MTLKLEVGKTYKTRRTGETVTIREKEPDGTFYGLFNTTGWAWWFEDGTWRGGVADYDLVVEVQDEGA